MTAPIGWVTYGPLPSDEYLKEIGYAIDPTQWKRGYARRQLRAGRATSRTTKTLLDYLI